MSPISARFLRIAKTASSSIPFLGLVLALALPAATLAREVTDATGARVKVTNTPKRIVTLMPSLGELAADLVGERLDRIVGVSEFTDYPPKLKKTESIGPYYRFNIEKVVVLKPDLVLATTDGNPKDQVLRLRELGLPVVVVSTHSFKEIEDSIRIVAEALGEQKQGGQIVSRLKAGISHIRARAQDRPRKKVLLQIGAEPFVVVGKKSFLHEALDAVGGDNVYGDLAAHYPRPSLEDAVSRNPEVILVLVLGTDLKPFRQMVKSWNEFKQINAVKNARVKMVQGDPIFRPSLRLLEGLALLEKAVHE